MDVLNSKQIKVISAFSIQLETLISFWSGHKKVGITCEMQRKKVDTSVKAHREGDVESAGVITYFIDPVFRLEVWASQSEDFEYIIPMPSLPSFNVDIDYQLERKLSFILEGYKQLLGKPPTSEEWEAAKVKAENETPEDHPF